MNKPYHLFFMSLFMFISVLSMENDKQNSSEIKIEVHSKDKQGSLNLLIPENTNIGQIKAFIAQELKKPAACQELYAFSTGWFISRNYSTALKNSENMKAIMQKYKTNKFELRLKQKEHSS